LSLAYFNNSTQPFALPLNRYLGIRALAFALASADTTYEVCGVLQQARATTDLRVIQIMKMLQMLVPYFSFLMFFSDRVIWV
jgi:hypothetical protein